MTNIVLCGGNGTRLWPISRTLMPKQFVQFFENKTKSLFQLTINRNHNICEQSFIVSNAEQYFLALDQLEEIGHLKTHYLLEPLGKNTAPAIALTCMAIEQDEIVLVTPSDHLIKNQQVYEYSVQRAKELAEKNFLVTFGIKPVSAETGFGYIEVDGEDAKAFHEKPNATLATQYFEAGNYYWNSGMFCFKAGVFLQELEHYAPEIFIACKKAYENAINDHMIRIRPEDMLVIPENSIDYAVMEKSQKVKVIVSEMNWSDVGSFDALSAELKNDENNNFIFSHKHVSLIDVQDLIVVDTEDALLISQKGSSQKVKEIVNVLKYENEELTKIHATVHRPWGTYTVLENEFGYKIKKIIVKPGKRLSLQKHLHRNEHWIVVNGTAMVQVENNQYLVRENESTYIKAGEVHRLENQGKIPLILIEVQVGSYTGEDDIIRIMDDFARDVSFV